MLLAIALTYVLVYNSQNIMSGPNVSLDVAMQKRDAYGSDFLWVRTDGREYLIRDSKTLERVQELFEPARELKHESKMYKKQRGYDQEREELRRKHDAAQAEAERQLVPIVEEAVRTGVATPLR